VRKEKYRKKKAQAAREHPLKSRLAKKDIPRLASYFPENICLFPPCCRSASEELMFFMLGETNECCSGGRLCVKRTAGIPEPEKQGKR
jgi:hypothetical protein